MTERRTAAQLFFALATMAFGKKLGLGLLHLKGNNNSSSQETSSKHYTKKTGHWSKRFNYES